MSPLQSSISWSPGSSRPGGSPRTWGRDFGAANHSVCRPYHLYRWASPQKSPHEGADRTDDGAENDAQEEPTVRRRRVEAILLLAKTPLSPRKLSQMANLSDATEARTQIRSLNQLYRDLGRAIRIELIAGGYRMLTFAGLAPWLSRLNHIPTPVRLSTPMMETLAVVAYRGPVSRAAVESVRGVACGELLRQLMERDFVRIAGRSEDLGRPYLYDTTKRFLQLFGLANKDALPPIQWHPLQEDQPEPVSPSDAHPSGDSSTPEKEPAVSIAVASVSPATAVPNLSTTDPNHGSDLLESNVVPSLDGSDPLDPTSAPQAVIEDEEDDLYEGVTDDDDDDDWDDEEDDDWDDDDEEDDDDKDDDELDDDWEEVEDGGDDDEDEDDATDWDDEEDEDKDDEEEEDWD